MSSFNPGCPQPPDIPNDSQDDFVINFDVLNNSFAIDHVPFGNTVTFATNANPSVLTSPAHGLVTGNTVNIVHFSSLVGDVLQPWNINGGPYTATVIDANTFSINANATANPPYFANSGAFSSPQINYGFHKKNFFPGVLQQGPNTVPPLGAPYSAYYSKAQKYIDPIDKLTKEAAQFFYQNSVGASFERQLTQLDAIEVNNINGKGFITPWGIKLNFGQLTLTTTSTIYDFPVPFTTAVWSIICMAQLPNPKDLTRVIGQMAAVGLTQFNARQANNVSLKTVPFFYLAIGV